MKHPLPTTRSRVRTRVATLTVALLPWAGPAVSPVRAQPAVPPVIPPSTLLEVLTAPAGPATRIHGPDGAVGAGEPGTAVRVRPEALAAATPGGLLRLDLAPGVSAVGVVEEVHRTLLGRLVVSGRVAGRPGGRFTLVANGTGGEVAGSVRLGAGEVYRLGHPAGGGPGLEVRRQGAPAVGGGNDEAEPPAPLTPLLPHARALAPASGPADDPDSFDLMIVYTAAARQDFGGTEAVELVCELAVEFANQCYANSGLPLRGRLVHTMESDYVESGSYVTDLARLAAGTLVSAGDVAQARDQYGADFVSLFTGPEGSSDDQAAAGRGYLNATPDESHAFSICLARNAFGLTLVHEIGHNMGCAHDAANAAGLGSPAFPFSYGWRWTGTDGALYRDVMAYPPGTPEPYFSSPLVTFQGVATGDPLQADNARTLTQNAAAFANYRHRTVGARPIVSITAPDQEAVRSTGKPARFTLTRAGTDLSQPLVVGVQPFNNYRYVSGEGHNGAQAGRDYQVPPPAVTIPAGAASADLLLLPGDPASAVGDGPFDSGYAVALNVLPADGYDVGAPDGATATIYRTDVALALSAPEPLAIQSSARPARLTVSRTGSLEQPLTFLIGLEGGDAVLGFSYAPGGDFTVSPALPPANYQQFPNYLPVIPAGQSSVDVVVSPKPEAVLPAAGRTAVFGIGTPFLGAAAPVYHLSPLRQRASITLLTSLPTASVAITANAATLSEGGSPVTLRFVRSGGDLSADLTVIYKVSGAAASTGSARLAPLGGTVVIPAGSAKAKVKVRAVDDGVAEGPQGLKVKLKAGAGYVPGDLPRVNLTVLDPRG